MPYRRPSSRLFRLNWQRHLLLVIGLVLALRALAWPLDMVAHRPASASPTVVAQADATTCHVQHDQHAGHRTTLLEHKHPAPSADGALPGSADDASVCLILCAIACAPLLLQVAELPAHSAAQPRYDAPQPLPLGVVAPPDLPPPIA